MTALRQKFIDEMELRGFSENTMRSYISVVRELARHFKRSPDRIIEDELKQYLLHRIRGGEMCCRNDSRQRECFAVFLSTGGWAPH